MRAPVLFTATLLVLALCGAFYFLQSDSASPDVALSANSPEQGLMPEESETADQDADLAALEDSDKTPAEVTRQSAEIQEAAATPDLEVEDGRIVGRVVDKTGAGIAGADLQAKQDHGFGSLDLFGPNHGITTGKGNAKSDKDGRFTIKCHWNGPTRVQALGAGFAPLERSTTVTPGTTSKVGELTLERGIQLAGQVFDHRGKPLAGAKLHRKNTSIDSGGFMILSSNNIGAVVTETDDEGRFEVDNQKAGSWKFTVAHEDHPDEKVEGELLNAGDRDDTLQVHMREGFTIQGRVTGMPSNADLSIGARKASGGAMGMAVIGIDLPGRSSRTAEVSAEGNFTINGLEEGEPYELKARESGGMRAFGHSTRSSTVSAKAGEVGVELEYSVGSTLVFQVVDGKSGDPLTKFKVEAGIDWPMPLMEEDNQTLQYHREGMVRYEGFRPDSVDDRAELKITAVGYDDYEQDDIAVPVGEEISLGVIRMRPIPVVLVTVVDNATGEPIEGARVTLAAAPDIQSGGRMKVQRSISIGSTEDDEIMPGGFGESNTGKTNASGIATVTSMPGVEVVITVKDKKYAPKSSERMSLPLIGDHELEMRMHIGGEVRVTVLDSLGQPLAGQNIQHKSPPGPDGMDSVGFGPGSGRKRTRSDGTALFKYLEPGMHGFKITEDKGGGLMVFQSASMGGGEKDTSFEDVLVVDGKRAELTIVAASRGELAGVITEAGQALVGATVRLEEKGKKNPFPGMMMMSGGGGLSAKTDGKGYFVLEDVKAADYTLSISHHSRAMDDTFDVDIIEGPQDFDVDLNVTIVEGRIRNEKGEPIAGIRVKPQRVDDSGGPRQQVRMVMVNTSGDDSETIISDGSTPQTDAITDEDGYYQLRGVAPDVEIQIKASGGDYEPMTSEAFSVPEGAVEDGVDFELREAGSLKVTILLPDGSPAQNVMVSATFKGESDERVEPKFQFVQRGGETSFSGMKPGRWTVTLRSMGSQEASDEQETEIVAGEQAEVILTKS
ncbi:MAG: hypothetical protein ACI841_004963 [Planctomycetota bacterium]|jgi:hypothetical protein